MNLARRYPTYLKLGLTTLIPAPVSFAQSRFTVDDMLDVVDVQISDLIDDGHWQAATATTPLTTPLGDDLS